MSTVNFNDTTPAAPADGSGNIRFQSDASGNISGNWTPGLWKTWTPASDALPMVINSQTIRCAQYMVMGPRAEIQFVATFNFGAPAASLLHIPLPVGSPITYATFAVTINVSSGAVGGFGFATPGDPRLHIRPYGGGLFALGDVDIYASGVYQWR
jgi:hypothetical protein